MQLKGLAGATLGVSIPTEEQQAGECSNYGLTGQASVQIILGCSTHPG